MFKITLPHYTENVSLHAFVVEHPMALLSLQRRRGRNESQRGWCYHGRVEVVGHVVGCPNECLHIKYRALQGDSVHTFHPVITSTQNAFFPLSSKAFTNCGAKYTLSTSRQRPPAMLVLMNLRMWTGTEFEIGKESPLCSSEV